MSIQPSRRLFSVAEYDQMVETGILREDDRLELIEGEIVAMSPIGSPHAACVRRLTRVLPRLLGDRTQLSVQCPVVIPDWSEPNPDVALLVPRDDDYVDAHPLPRQVQVLIEVADSSLAYDTQVKAPLYAKAGIRELWIVDLKAKRVVVYTRPRSGRYSVMRVHGVRDRFTSPRFAGAEFAVRELLP
ncbi:MAG TPA: Uma2 family endonuclease [Pirellulales bacterium]|nr:Uma2 family endonuclease [Pirellulales bacterium]